MNNFMNAFLFTSEVLKKLLMILFFTSAFMQRSSGLRLPSGMLSKI